MGMKANSEKEYYNCRPICVKLTTLERNFHCLCIRRHSLLIILVARARFFYHLFVFINFENEFLVQWRRSMMTQSGFRPLSAQCIHLRISIGMWLFSVVHWMEDVAAMKMMTIETIRVEGNGTNRFQNIYSCVFVYMEIRVYLLLRDCIIHRHTQRINTKISTWTNCLSGKVKVFYSIQIHDPQLVEWEEKHGRPSMDYFVLPTSIHLWQSGLSRVFSHISRVLFVIAMGARMHVPLATNQKYSQRELDLTPLVSFACARCRAKYFVSIQQRARYFLEHGHFYWCWQKY